MLTPIAADLKLPKSARDEWQRRLRASAARRAMSIPVRPGNPSHVGRDALADIISAWSEIVGQRVAAVSAPEAVLGNHTLRVVVTSSAWANQMAFEAPKILVKLNALVPGAAAFARLSYRVGKLTNDLNRSTTPVEQKQIRRSPTEIAIELRASGTESPAEARTVEEAIERCRRKIAAIRTKYFAEGGRSCTGCGALIDSGSQCRPCLDGSVESRRLACALLLHADPTTTSRVACAKVANLTEVEFERVRRHRLRSYYDEIVRARDLAAEERPIDVRRVSAAATAYVALETRLGSNVSAAIRKNALGELYEFIASIERYSTLRE